MKLLDLLLKRKVAVGLTVVLVIALGLYATSKLDQELMPPITLDGAQVSVDAGDMATSDVEKKVTNPLEQVLLGMDGVESVQSSSTIGNSSLSVTIEEGKGEEVSKEIEAKLSGMKDQLQGADEIYVAPYTTNGTYEFYMDLSNGEKVDMEKFGKDVLEPRLEALNEVSDVDLVGLDQRELVIEFNQEELANNQLNVQQVVGLIQQANSNEVLGSLEGEPNTPTVRWNTSLQSVKDVENLMIPTVNGMKTVSDFADVQLKNSEDMSGIWKNGEQNFIFVQIGRNPDVTQIDMAEAVRAEVENIREDGLVDGFELNEVVTQADYVSDSISGVTQNVLIGGLLALVVLLLFLRNVRATIIIGLSIPTSILLTFISMWVLDYSFNMLSLIGLGLGIGMMVDASIVILESIFKNKEQGIGNKEAVRKGIKEVASAVMASMLTTIVVFLPIGLLGGDPGKFMIILSVIIVITLASSVVVSFTLIPSLGEKFLKVKNEKKEKKAGKIITSYSRVLRWMGKKKRYRYGLIFTFLLVFVGSLALVTKIPMTLMPDVYNRYSEVMIQLESGVTPEEREKVAKALHASVADVADITDNIVMDNINSMYMLINMTKGEDVTVEQEKVNEQMLSSIRELETDYPISNVAVGMAMGGGFPVSLQVSGKDMETLDLLADELSHELESIDGLVGVTTTADKIMEERQIVLNEAALEEDQLTPIQIHQYLGQFFGEMPIGQMTIEDQSNVAIFVKSDVKNDREADLLHSEIVTPVGRSEKLSKYLSFETVETPTQINHKDGERFIRVMADLDGKDLGSVNRDIEKILDNFEVPNGYTVSVAGDVEAQQEAMQDMLVILGIALFLVYAVMAVQFNSFKHPIIVMTILPFTMTGVLVGLFVTQMELSIMSGMGVLMLIGIVLNNAILLIDRTNQLRSEGKSARTAVKEAGKSRIRPIFMTTLTTVGGMIPLALASGTASAYQAPLATVVISGLLFSTLITLLLIPAVYLLFEDISQGIKRVFLRKQREVLEEEYPEKVAMKGVGIL